MRKKFLFIFLSVILTLGIVSCGKSVTEMSEEETESPELIEDIDVSSTEQSKEEAAVEDLDEAEMEEPDLEEPEASKEPEEKQATAQQTASVSSTAAEDQSADSQNTGSSSASNTQTTETVAATAEPAYQPTSYSPQNVVSMAIAKCQAGGMVTTTDNLSNLLANGTITQEEYNEYYPYDGLGYYSVFVQTDLNAASTTSGRLLGSEDGIAQYIADMLLLENDPIFNIEYAGVTNTGGTDFYEFKCYR